MSFGYKTVFSWPWRSRRSRSRPRSLLRAGTATTPRRSPSWRSAGGRPARRRNSIDGIRGTRGELAKEARAFGAIPEGKLPDVVEAPGSRSRSTAPAARQRQGALHRDPLRRGDLHPERHAAGRRGPRPRAPRRRRGRRQRERGDEVEAPEVHGHVPAGHPPGPRHVEHGPRRALHAHPDRDRQGPVRGRPRPRLRRGFSMGGTGSVAHGRPAPRPARRRACPATAWSWPPRRARSRRRRRSCEHPARPRPQRAQPRDLLLHGPRRQELRCPARSSTRGDRIQELQEARPGRLRRRSTSRPTPVWRTRSRPANPGRDQVHGARRHATPSPRRSSGSTPRAASRSHARGSRGEVHADPEALLLLAPCAEPRNQQTIRASREGNHITSMRRTKDGARESPSS